MTTLAVNERGFRHLWRLDPDSFDPPVSLEGTGVLDAVPDTLCGERAVDVLSLPNTLLRPRQYLQRWPEDLEGEGGIKRFVSEVVTCPDCQHAAREHLGFAPRSENTTPSSRERDEDPKTSNRTSNHSELIRTDAGAVYETICPVCDDQKIRATEDSGGTCGQCGFSFESMTFEIPGSMNGARMAIDTPAIKTSIDFTADAARGELNRIAKHISERRTSLSSDDDAK